MSDIRRIYGSKTLVIPAGSSLSTEPIDMRRVVSGVVGVSASWTAADIGFMVSSGSVSSDAQLLHDSTGSVIQITSPSLGTAFEIPSSVFFSHYAWLFSQSAGTAVDQTASASLVVQIKS